MLRMTEARRGRGWSRADLGRRARVHPSDVGKIEAGRLLPYPAQARRLARVLGLTAETLLEEVRPDDAPDGDHAA